MDSATENVTLDKYAGINTRRNILMLLAAFMLGILFVYLFYGKPIGISVPIFITAFYTILLIYTRNGLSRDAKFGWFLTIPVFMLSLSYFLFGNEILHILTILALPLLILLQTLLVTGCNVFKWYSPWVVIDLFLGMFFRCFVHFNKPFKVVASVIRKRGGKSKVNPTVSKVLIGLLVSIPLVIILMSLLASADTVFGLYIDRIPDIFSFLKIDDFAGKAFVALIIFFISFSYLWSLGQREKPGSGIQRELEVTIQKLLDPAIVITIMIVIDAVYIAFVAIQFAYLFGGSNFGLPSNFTYAEYARKGFFELIAVTIINLAILGGFLSFTKKSGNVSAIVLKALYSSMVFCTFVMLASAHFRMSLYEDAYGFTYLRIFTHCFMAFLLVLFIVALARVWDERVKLLKSYIAVAVTAFVIVNYINVDAIIACKNIERYNRQGQIDVEYLTTLSYDAVPELVKLAGTADQKVSDSIKTALLSKKKELGKEQPWQACNLSEVRTRTALIKLGN